MIQVRPLQIFEEGLLMALWVKGVPVVLKGPHSWVLSGSLVCELNETLKTKAFPVNLQCWLWLKHLKPKTVLGGTPCVLVKPLSLLKVRGGCRWGLLLKHHMVWRRHAWYAGLGEGLVVWVLKETRKRVLCGTCICSLDDVSWVPDL